MRYTSLDIPKLSDQAFNAAGKNDVLVWWDVYRGDFRVLLVGKPEARKLLKRFDAAHGLVGVFTGSASLRDIEDAMHAHFRGVLA